MQSVAHREQLHHVERKGRALLKHQDPAKRQQLDGLRKQHHRFPSEGVAESSHDRSDDERNEVNRRHELATADGKRDGVAGEEVEPELDQALLNMVCQMGIPENPAKHALYKSGGTDADLAVTWYFENMADESINLPLRVKKAGAPSSGDEVPREMVEMMLAMGFPEKKCIKALKKCDNNPERATDWLFSHMDDPDSDVEMTEEVKNEEEYSCDKPGFYKLQSFITHLGASVHAGHYVCHVKKDGKWVYFNDAKVAETTEPPIGKGYLYFFQKD